MFQSNWYKKDKKQYIRVSCITAQTTQIPLQWPANCAVEYIDKRLGEIAGTAWVDAIWEVLEEAKHEHKRQSEHSLDIGQTVHHLINDLDSEKTSVLDIPEVYNGYCSYLKFHKEYAITRVLSEQVVYSEKYGFAGTFDELGEAGKFDNALYLLDYKTSVKLYPRQIIMQLTAYRQAYFETFGVWLENLANVRLYKDKIDYQWREYTEKEKDIGWNCFLNLLNYWKELRRWGKN